jgi:integrase
VTAAPLRFSVGERCACPEGKSCPRLYRADGSWNSRHGSAEVNARIPVSSGTWRLHWSGYPSKAAARATGEQIGQLLALAGPDAVIRAQIGDMIRAAGKDGLPAVADVQRRLGLGQDPGQAGMTTGEWLEAWLASRRTIRPSTLRSYRQHVSTWLIPHLGHLQLERLTAAHISAMFAAIDRSNAELARQRVGGRAVIEIEGDVRSQPRPVGPATQRRILATLRAALNAAVKQRQIMYNPCQGVELAAEAPPARKRWTPAEAATFLAATASDPLGLMFRIAVLRGLRRGELCGLRWAGADLEAGVLVVDHTILELDGHLVNGVPKTAAGVRRVYLDAETAGLLRAHRKAQLAARLRAGDEWQDNGLIFCRFDGTPWRPSYVSRRIKVLAAQAGVPVITLHEGGRHTGTSLMGDADVREDIRMREVGHSDRDVHARYTHVLDAAHREAAEQVAALVRQAGGTP